MTAHFTHGSPQSKELTDEVIDAFGIAGPAAYCIERLTELREMGLTRFYLTGPGRGADREEAEASHRRIVERHPPRPARLTGRPVSTISRSTRQFAAAKSASCCWRSASFS